MDTSASALSLGTCGIAETSLAETGHARFDIAGFWIVEQFKLQSSQGFFKSECCHPLRKDTRLDEGQG
jgi:hypothetical protein